MKKIRIHFKAGVAMTLALTFLALAPLACGPGCKSATEQTVQTSASVTEDAVDVAMNAWAVSWARRENAATAATNSAALAGLATEQNTVQTALAAYQAAFRIAITSWVASKDALATNAAPTAAALAGFSTAFASASTNLVTLLQSIH